MKFTVAFASLSLVVLFFFTSTTNGETYSINQGSPLLPLEKSLTRRIRRDLDVLQSEIAEAKPRFLRQAPTEPTDPGQTGGSGGGIINVIKVIKGIASATEFGLGFLNGIIGRVDGLIQWLGSGSSPTTPGS